MLSVEEGVARYAQWWLASVGGELMAMAVR